jgi:Cu+-exporting ATPase
MHPQVTSAEPGRCPICGMRLLAGQPEAGGDAATTGHAEHAEHHHGHAHGEGAGDGIEWEAE